ncbi:9503_t:CDS:2, partial [Gigaspora margarita]
IPRSLPNSQPFVFTNLSIRIKLAAETWPTQIFIALSIKGYLGETVDRSMFNSGYLRVNSSAIC